MFPQQKPQSQLKPKKEKESRCRITTKTKRDGSVVKEISGNCSKEKLEALSMESKRDSEF